MSILSQQADDLRNKADELRHVNVDDSSVELLFAVMGAMREAADTITSLRDRLQAAELGNVTSSSEAANPQVRCTDSKRNAPGQSREDSHTLLPCPFCGGEAHAYRNNLWHVGCEHAHNGCVTMSAFVTEAEAIAAWNTRATMGSGECKVEEVPSGAGWVEFQCSVCGSNRIDKHDNYCPNCGRRVEHERD